MGDAAQFRETVEWRNRKERRISYMSVVISPEREDLELTDEQFRQLGEIWSHDRNGKEHAVAGYVHRDSEHDHLHLFVPRDYFSKKEMERNHEATRTMLREMERSRDLDLDLDRLYERELERELEREQERTHEPDRQQDHEPEREEQAMDGAQRDEQRQQREEERQREAERQAEAEREREEERNPFSGREGRDPFGDGGRDPFRDRDDRDQEHDRDR